MRHGSLFSGIGGFDLAAEWMGWENVFHCEWNTFGQRVLKHYWPKAKSYHDITQTDFTIHRGSIDILTGGFPCQPYSAAGKRLGKEDERHLWPEMLRVIREVAPKYIVGENVLGLVNWNGGLVFDEVQADLEAEGYEVATVVIPAAAVNAPHGRDRVWFVAHRNNTGNTTQRCGIEQHRTQKSEEREYAQPKFDGYCINGLTKDTLCDGRIQREPIEEGAEVREQRNAGAGDSKRICGTEMAGLTAHNAGKGLEGSARSRLQGRSNGFADIGNERFTADTECNGLEYGDKTRNIRSKEETPCGKGSKSTNDIATNGENANVADTDEQRLERQTTNRNMARLRFSFSDFKNRSDWQNFPTQSPICSGDDGLPRELDGITFSKWRNESIRAYGNAIVPNVAFEIFKVIQIIANT